MRDGNVPRFFVRQGGPSWWSSSRDQLSRTQLSSSQLFQLFMILLAREGKGERRGERGQEERRRAEGMEEDGKLFVEQIKTKKRRVPAPCCIILLSHNLLCLFNDLKEVIDIHKRIRKVGIAENINPRFCE